MFERRRRYDAAYCHKEPCGDEEIVVALKWLDERRTPGAGRILVLSPGRANVEHSPVLHHLSTALHFETERTFPKQQYRWRGGIALALWPTAKMLALLDDAPQLAALAAVPWQLKDLDVWRAATCPLDLLGRVERLYEPTIADPVVRVAIEHLTAGVNLGTGLTHPSDRARAIETFRLLRKAGHSWSPDEIHAWALANGWRNGGATELRDYAEGVLEGKRYRVGDAFGLKASAVATWRSEASRADVG